MSKTIDGIGYPEDFDGVLRNRELAKVFFEYAKKSSLEENVEFYLTARKLKPQMLFFTFLDDGASKPINVSDAIRRPFRNLAAAQNWDPRAWRAEIGDAERAIYNLIDSNCFPAFWRSPQFKKYHERNLRKVTKIPKKLIDDLGANKEADVLGLIDAFRSSKSAGTSLADKLLKKRKITMTAKEIEKTFKRFKLF